MDAGIKGGADRKVDRKFEGVGVGSSVGLMHESGSGVGVRAVMVGQSAVVGHLRAN